MDVETYMAQRARINERRDYYLDLFHEAVGYIAIALLVTIGIFIGAVLF